MVDVAELVMRGRAEGFDEANAKLRTTQTEAAKTEGAVEGMGRAMSRVDPHVQNMNRAMASAGAQSKALQQAGLNMGRQFTDVGVQMAMGMNPFMIALQQGPQIIDGFQVAAMQMGTTVRGAMVAMGTAIWTALAPLLPIIAAVAAAAAIGFGSFALATRAAGREIGNLTEGMNLSEAQLKKLKEENVSTTTTMGDVWNAAGTTIKEGFFDLFGDQVDVIGRKWDEFLDAAWKAVVTTSKNIVGSFVGAFYAIRDTWRMIPAAVGDATISAANLVVRGTENMINGAVRLLNGLIEKANAAANAVGLRNFLPRLSPVDLAEYVNPFMGALNRLGRQGAESFREGFEAGSGLVERTASRLLANIEASGRTRIQRALGDTSEAVRDVGASASEAAGKAERLVERLQRLERVDIQPLDVRMPNVVDPLIGIVDELRLIDGLARDAAYGMAEAFGEAGRSVGDALVALSSYQTISAQIALDAKQGRLTEAQAAREQANLQIRTYGDMASAAKGFFDENSAGYRTMQAVEQAYRAVQFANAAKAILLDKTETGSTVAMNAIKSASHGVVAVARAIASMPFPLNIAAGAATAASLVAFGVRMFGGGGGGATYTPPAENTGTGTVLGSPDEASESLSRSLEMAERYQDRDLQYSSEMVNALRAIETSIGSLTTSIAQQMQVGGSFDTSGLGLGTSSKSGFLGIFGGSTKTSELAGQGLQFSAQTVGQMIQSGVNGLIWQAVEHTKTSKGFFGIGGGTKSWITESTRGIGSALSQQFGEVIATLREGVLAAAGQLGIEGADAALNAMRISLGRIDFAGLSSAEINERLSAIFSAAGDQMAQAVAPGLRNLQQAGEGMLETLTRLATEYQAVDNVMSSMGSKFRLTGLASLETRDRLVQLTGGLEAFVEQANFFTDNFMTEAQQLAPIQKAVTAEMKRLGLSGVNTREAFASLVTGIDVSTAKGAALYAALMNVAPAFDKVVSASEDAAEALTDKLARAVEEAAGRVSAAQDELRRAYDTEAARLNAIVGAVDDARDTLRQAYEAERGELTSTADALRNTIQTLRAFRHELDLNPYAMNSPSQQYAATRADFRASGAESLPETAKAFLDASMASSGSRLDYMRDLAEVRRAVAVAEAGASKQLTDAEKQIAALDKAVGKLIDLNTGVLTVGQAISGLLTAQQEAAIAQAQLSRLDAQVGGLISINASVVSVKDAIAALAQATAAQAAAQAAALNQSDKAAKDALAAAKAAEKAAAGVKNAAPTVPTPTMPAPVPAVPDALNPKNGPPAWKLGPWPDEPMMTMFAAGGVFTSPTTFAMGDQYGQLAESGPEAIMPLAQMPGGGLGVRVANDNDSATEIKALRAEVVSLKQTLNAALVAVAQNTGRIDSRQQRWEGVGLPVRGPVPGSPVEVTGVNGEPVVTEAA